MLACAYMLVTCDNIITNLITFVLYILKWNEKDELEGVIEPLYSTIMLIDYHYSITFGGNFGNGNWVNVIYPVSFLDWREKGGVPPFIND